MSHLHRASQKVALECAYSFCRFVDVLYTDCNREKNRFFFFFFYQHRIYICEKNIRHETRSFLWQYTMTDCTQIRSSGKCRQHIDQIPAPSSTHALRRRTSRRLTQISGVCRLDPIRDSTRDTSWHNNANILLPNRRITLRFGLRPHEVSEDILLKVLVKSTIALMLLKTSEFMKDIFFFFYKKCILFNKIIVFCVLFIGFEKHKHC